MSVTCLADHRLPNSVLIDGLALCVRDAGGAGLPFIFEHGVGGDDEQTFQVLPPMPGIRPVTLNCPGHGGSEMGDPERISIPYFADLLTDFIDRSFDRKVLLGGISMGAALALEIAVRRPDLVLGLVLARPGWIEETTPPNVAPLAEAGRLLKRYDAATARALFVKTASGRRLAAESPLSLRSLLQFFGRVPQAEMAELLIRMADSPTGVSRSEIAALRVPTLVVGTETEAVHPLPLARSLAELIPGARLDIIASKAVDRTGYLLGFKSSLVRFLREF